MSTHEALTAAREALLEERRKLDRGIAVLDELLGVKRAGPVTETRPSGGATFRETKRKTFTVPAPRTPSQGGQQPHATSPDRVAKIQAAFEAGGVAEQLGPKFGVSPQTVRNLAKKFGWKRPAPPVRKLRPGESRSVEA